MNTDNQRQIVNLDQLIEIAIGNPTYRRNIINLIKRIVEKGIAPAMEIRRAWGEGRVGDAAHMLHAMRGEIGTLGAERFTLASLNAEKAIVDNEMEQVGVLLDAVEQELRVALDATQKWLNDQSEV